MSDETARGSFRVLYYAAATSYTRRDYDDIAAPLRLCDLFKTLDGMYPGIMEKVLSSSAVAVNLKYIDVPGPEDGQESFIIQERDEVAIIPPVSSG